MSTADAVALGAAEAPRRAHMSVWWRFRRHRLALFGFVVLAVFGFVAVAAPIVAVQDAFAARLALDNAQRDRRGQAVDW